LKNCSTFFTERSESSPNSIVTVSRVFVGERQEAIVETRTCLRNGVTVPSPRRAEYTGTPTHRSYALSPMESRSVSKKQFGPRELHQSARGADGLKAVTFPADVTGSYFTRSVPTPSSCSLFLFDPPSSSTYVSTPFFSLSLLPFFFLLPSLIIIFFELLLQQNKRTRT